MARDPRDNFLGRIVPTLLLLIVYVSPGSGSGLGGAVVDVAKPPKEIRQRPPPPQRRQPSSSSLKQGDDDKAKSVSSLLETDTSSITKPKKYPPAPPRASSLAEIYNNIDEGKGLFDSGSNIDDEDSIDEEDIVLMESHNDSLLPPPPRPITKRDEQQQQQQHLDEKSNVFSKSPSLKTAQQVEETIPGDAMRPGPPAVVGQLEQQQQQQGDIQIRSPPDSHFRQQGLQQQQYPQQYPPPQRPPPASGTTGIEGNRRPRYQQQQQQQQWRPSQQFRPQERAQQQRFASGTRATGHPPAYQRQHVRANALSSLNRNNIMSIGKSLWSNVEKGLDNLVDLEDEVAYRAKKQLRKLPGIKTKSTSRGGNRSFDSSSTWDNLINREHPQQQQQQPKGYSPERHQQKVRPEASIQHIQQQKQQYWNNIFCEKSDSTTGSTVDDSRKQEVSVQPKQMPSQLYSSIKETATGAQRQQPPAAATANRYTQQQQQESSFPKVGSSSPLSLLKAGVSSSTSTTVSNKYDVDEERSRFQWLSRMVPSIPRFRKDNSKDILDEWDDMKRHGDLKTEQKKKTKRTSSPLIIKKRTSRRLGRVAKELSSNYPPPVVELIDRYDGSLRKGTLLTSTEKRRCRSIGRNMAILDVGFLSFLMIGIRQLTSWLMLMSENSEVLGIAEMTIKSLGATLLSLGEDTWTYLALAAAYLALCMKTVYIIPNVSAFIMAACHNVRTSAQYGQLYLRLVSSISMKQSLPQQIEKIMHSQIVSTITSVRLRTFVFLCALKVVIVRNLAIIAQVITPLFDVLYHLLQNIKQVKELLQWPPPITLPTWNEIVSSTTMQNIQQAIQSSFSISKLKEVFAAVGNEPLLLCLQSSVAIALFVTAFVIPSLVRLDLKASIKRSSSSFEPGTENEEDEGEEESSSLAENLSRLGGSSATRLHLLSQDGAVEEKLERWWTLASRQQRLATGMAKMHSTIIRFLGFVTGVTFIMLMPLSVWKVLNGDTSFNSLLSSFTTAFKMQYIDLMIIFCFTVGLTWNAIKHVVDYDANYSSVVLRFLKTLMTTIQELSSVSPQNKSMQLSSRLSPGSGIKVSDLWVAHKARHGWAVKGANIECRNGKVVLLLGDNGVGKTRLLTSLSEAIVCPPKRSQTTTKVRGSVAVDGIDVSQWDRAQLKRQVGLVLNDVRTVPDMADLVSGSNLQEILEPRRISNGSQRDVSRERNAIALALQITGLSSSLLPRLPSKLMTAVSASEDEIGRSSLRSWCNVLSPSEWPKLIVAQVLSQTIFNSGNNVSSMQSSPDSSTSAVDGCLMGTVLILDDMTICMSEEEETKFLKMIKKGGAATVLSSNRWSTGRYADRIYVVGKDGTIVESGTHDELVNRDPQGSVYAAKWQALMKAP